MAMEWWVLSLVVAAYVGVHSAGIIANLTVIFLISTSTPNNLKRFSLLLLNTAITDFIANFAGLMAIPRLLAIGKGMVMSFYGWCQWTNHGICLTSYCTMITFHIHSTICLPLSFFYRWWILSHPAPSKLAIFVAILCTFPLSLVEFESCFRNLSENVTDITGASPERESIDNNTVIGFHSMKNQYVMQTLLGVFLVIVVVYIIVIILRRQTKKLLAKAELANTAICYEMHKRLLKVVTLQAVVPLGTVLTALQYLFAQFVRSDLDWLQFLTVMPMNSISLIQPLITLYFVVPYRKALIGSLAKNQPSVGYIVSSSMQTTAQQETPQDAGETL